MGWKLDWSRPHLLTFWHPLVQQNYISRTKSPTLSATFLLLLCGEELLPIRSSSLANLLSYLPSAQDGETLHHIFRQLSCSSCHRLELPHHLSITIFPSFKLVHLFKRVKFVTCSPILYHQISTLWSSPILKLWEMCNRVRFRSALVGGDGNNGTSVAQMLKKYACII
jgi:hypothetical protein